MLEFIRTRNWKKWLALAALLGIVALVTDDYFNKGDYIFGIMYAVVMCGIFTVGAMAAHQKWF